MIPKEINLEVLYSPLYVQQFRRHERHIVCIADADHPTLEYFIGARLETQGDMNEAMDWVNMEGFVTQFFRDHNYAISVIPQLTYTYSDDLGNVANRFDYMNRPFLSRCIKNVFTFNREIIHAPYMTFVFEYRNFNIREGIELMYHHATSNAVRNDRMLREITYWDMRSEPDEDFMIDDQVIEVPE